ncbi:hypothetical protein [Vibrio parahaemolyticus]|nr:hypothetical protein [Vibrio parahaemolyticus]
MRPWKTEAYLDAEWQSKNSEKLMDVIDYINRNGAGEIWLVG